MSECTLCGRHQPMLNKIEIEDAIAEVCDDCSKFGRMVERAGERKRDYKPMQKHVDLAGIVKDEDVVFVADYGKRVNMAREARGLTRTEFAKKINERESIIRRIERQEMEPDDLLKEKIERFLNVKLTELYDD